VSAVTLGRVVVVAALAGVAILAAALLSGGSDAYKLKAQFEQAGGLRAGFKVRVDGAPVGKIDKLELDSQDRVVATLLIDKSAAPVGRDVRATARAADLLGEKFVDLEPGNRQQPAPSGTVIPPARTGLAIELDDVINAVDLPTRQALRTFIAEQGVAYVGRGRDIGATLAVLPWALDRSGKLLDQFATDNRALERLVDESDRVVTSVARERGQLGRFVSAASGTLQTLGNRQAELGATVRKAPATLAAARRALASLEGAAIPLGPAARGLRATAPQLTATLNELPGFTAAARPTLREARRVSPTLRTLGRQGAPVVRHLKPLAADLDSFAGAFEPVTETLDKGIADVLGVLEGWARSTQARDTASHVFRFGATVSPYTFSALAGLLATQPTARRDKSSPRKRTPLVQIGPKLDAPAGKAPAIRLPKVPEVKLPEAVRDLTRKLGIGGSDPGSPTANAPASQLLDYLLK
jgi:phospholipid/cholesterol/gamma-HCH transport system substrate-binding protein